MGLGAIPEIISVVGIDTSNVDILDRKTTTATGLKGEGN